MIKPKALQHAGQVIPYRVQHKKAVTRRIHLKTDADGSLLVIAPRRMSRRAVHDTLQERVHKVADFLAGARKKLEETPELKYLEGERHLFMGQWLTLEFVRSTSGRGFVQLSSEGIRVTSPELDPDRVSNLLAAWYRQQSQDHFRARMKVIAGQAPWIQGGPPALRVRKMKRTWGNCSLKRGITLNTQLIKTPPHCIDYLIAHELCHVKEMNHGPAFYALQSRLFPGWRAARSELQEQAHVYLDG